MLFIAISFTANAQQEVAEFLKLDLNDANKLATAYMEPFGKMFGTSLNGGWYQAARPHKLFGFNLTFTTVVALPYADSKTFDFKTLELSNSLSLKNASDNLSPTITGKGDGIPIVYTTQIQGQTVNVDLNLPKGASLPFTPMPFIQGGIGLPYHNELTIRFFPTVSIPKVGKMGMWGVGLKNEFKEFIPVLKAVPIDLSVMLGYTKFSSEFDIAFKPQDYTWGTSTSADYDNQKLALGASGYTARILVGKTIPILSVYAGLGYSHATTDFNLEGLYPITINQSGQSTNLSNANDPISLAFTNSEFSANAGLRLRFSVIAIHFDYTLGKYSLVTAGLGISFR